MSTLSLGMGQIGTPLKEMLMCEAIEPGSAASYQLCKTIYTYHPLGMKMADTPIKIAQSQRREVAVQRGPEDRLRTQFNLEWDRLNADQHIRNSARLARVYGISSLALKVKDTDSEKPVDYKRLWESNISFNTLDPLNTSGSLVLNQDPNAMDFQHVSSIAVAGQRYHPSRTRTLMNESPIYIEYTTSAYGYVGRSVYQRALFPLKSFISTMITDDMVARKAGLLVAKMNQPGSIINNLMAAVAGIKRNLLKQAATDNVLEVGHEDEIESIDLKNLEAPAAMARKNIIENTASASDMPAKLLLQESFAEGFGEGSEDAKHVASFIDDIRIWMRPYYDFMDEIVMRRAWNPEFFKIIQTDFSDYQGRDYEEVFYEWKNSFSTKWPSLITEPESEKVKVDDVKLKAVLALLEVLLSQLDPANKVELIKWACDNFNELKLMFGSMLTLDYEALEEYVPPEPAKEVDPGRPFADALTEAVARLPQRRARIVSAS